MRKTGRHIVLCLVFLMGVLQGQSQSTRVFASVDKNPVEMEETFSYRITLENGSGDIIPPNLGDFTVIFGPAKSSNYRFINGQQSSTLTLTYTMRPSKVGKFTIGAGKALVDGKTLETEPIEVEVVAQGSTKPMQTQTQRNTKTDVKPQTSDGSENLQVIISLNKTRAFIGEQIIAQYILLTRYSNMDISNTKLPSPSGFWTEDVQGDPAWERNYHMINGVPFRKAVLKTQILIPQRAGELTIDPIEITALVNRSIFNRGTEYNVKSKSPVITVSPHPGTAPMSYNGAVGNFKYNVDLNKNEVDANEAIELKIVVSGSGNLSLISEPEIQFPADFEVYDPEINDRISVSENGISGSRTFQYLIIPRYPGDYEIPKFEFAYFNPSQKQYITKQGGPYEIKVTGEAGMTTQSQGGLRSQNKVTESGTEIRYIINNPERLELSSSNFYGSKLFGFMLGAPFVGLLLFLLVRKRNEDRNKDFRQVKKRNANKLARRRLRAAAKALKANESATFYAEIFSALYGYLGDRLGIDGSQLSRVIIFSKLKEQQIDQALIDQLASTLDTCEMARFAPTTQSSEQAFYDQTVKLIESLENQLK